MGRRIEIVCINTDRFKAFGRKAIVVNWFSRERNWTTSEIPGRMDIEKTVTSRVTAISRIAFVITYRTNVRYSLVEKSGL